MQLIQSRAKEFSNSTGGKARNHKNIPSCVYKKEAPQSDSRALPTVPVSSTTGTDSLTPASALSQANQRTGLVRDWPMTSYRCPRISQSQRGRVVNSNGNSSLRRSAQSIAAPNSNHRSLTLANSARGGACRREPGTRGVIAQEKGRCSSSGQGPSPASLGLRHG